MAVLPLRQELIVASFLAVSAQPFLPTLKQKLFVIGGWDPCYNPDDPAHGQMSCDWDQIVSDTASRNYSAIGTVAISVSTNGSGPGTGCSADWLNVTQRVLAADPNINLVGMVTTSYLARPVAQVKADIDTWYSCYPGLGGIYIDEVSTTAPGSLAYVSSLYSYIHSTYDGKSGPPGHTRAASVTVMGLDAADDSFMNASDVLLTYAGTYSDYVSYMPPSFTQSYNATRFAHIVISAACDNFNPNSPHLDAMRRSKNNNAGNVYVTDAGTPTPFSRLPQPYIYWDQELRWAVDII